MTTKVTPVEKRQRTSYKCKKCGQPKRGHICPFRSKVVLPGEEKDTRDAECQAEFDEAFVARALDLASQGFPESYGEPQPVKVAPFEMPPYWEPPDETSVHEL